MDLTNIWHYHRPTLAALYLKALNAGVVVSTTIFAPRRTGKTSFLLKDLKPAAEKAGFQVIYADLWQTRQAPASALLRALELALAPRTMPQKIAARLKAPVKSIKAGADLAGARFSGEMTLASEPASQAEMGLQVTDLIARLCKKQPVLLLIDEAQELGRSKENELVATALRTAITLYQNRLRVVFAGSSRSQLAHLFANIQAPLYSSGAAITAFPLLDRGFVRYVAKQYARSSGRTLDADAAWRAFETLRCQPEPFLKAVMSMVLDPALSLAKALRTIAGDLLRDENHAAVWTRLDATQQLLVQILAADPNTKPFSNEALVQLRRRLGVDTLMPTHVQRALARLALANVVVKNPGGAYEFEDPVFLDWLRAREG